MYRVIFTWRALKDLKNINKEIQYRIATKLKEYAKKPLKYARKLINPRIGTDRFRIGDYRVIFDIDNEIIVILRIGHRRSIYKWSTNKLSFLSSHILYFRLLFAIHNLPFKIQNYLSAVDYITKEDLLQNCEELMISLSPI